MAVPPSSPAPAVGASRPHAVVHRAIPVLLQTPPVHRLLSAGLMLITCTGRKSGRRFTTPVTYLPTAAGALFLSNQRWWRNLTGGAPVTFRLRGRDISGIATPVEAAEAVIREARAYLARHGRAKAGRIGLVLDPARVPTDDDLAATVRDHVVVSVSPRHAEATTRRERPAV